MESAEHVGRIGRTASGRMGIDPQHGHARAPCNTRKFVAEFALRQQTVGKPRAEQQRRPGQGTFQRCWLLIQPGVLIFCEKSFGDALQRRPEILATGRSRECLLIFDGLPEKQKTPASAAPRLHFGASKDPRRHRSTLANDGNKARDVAPLRQRFDL